jgi:hypothetical protein
VLLHKYALFASVTLYCIKRSMSNMQDGNGSNIAGRHGSRIGSIKDPESLRRVGSDATLEMSIMTTIMLFVCACLYNF